MPRTDLRGLREYVANVLDYDPDNETYKRQIDRLLNEADRAICLAKPFTFTNKVVDVTAYKDVSGTITFSSSSTTISTGSAFFLDWMVNQELVVDNVTYTIVQVDAGGTTAFIDRNFEGTSGAQTGTVINRYLDLPVDCTSVLGVARRTNARTPNNPGMLSPLSRYEDEWHNLPLGEINLPVYWMNYDAAYIEGPRKNYELTTASTSSAGQRTIEITSTYIRGGRESSHGEIQALSLTATQNLVVDPVANTANTGLLKRYYFRAPDLGYQEFRLLDDPNNVGQSMELASSDTAPRTITVLTQTNLENSEALYRLPRMQNADGFVQRIRLYPRQDQDYVFSIRYMQNHRPMVEDGDTSSIPPDQRMVIAYMALSDILMKHDNPTQSELYRRRADEILLRIEKRYLISPARRIVKGNWLANMEPNSFSRFTTLVHT
tara:strand:+ start:271 stop:1572 length:1302 start_codon:yes stop_codon:yes gene_type:complete